MTQLSTVEAIRVSKMNPTSKSVDLGNRIRNLEGSANVVTGTEAQIPICGADGVPVATTVSGDATISALGAVTIAADSVEQSMIAEGAVGSTEIAENAVGASEIDSGAVGTAELADDAVNTAKAKIVVRAISVLAENKTGNIITAADIDGVVLGFSVYNAGSAVKTCRMNPGTGQIDVELAENQAAEQDATFNVVVLQA